MKIVDATIGLPVFTYAVKVTTKTSAGTLFYRMRRVVSGQETVQIEENISATIKGSLTCWRWPDSLPEQGLLWRDAAIHHDDVLGYPLQTVAPILVALRVSYS